MPEIYEHYRDDMAQTYCFRSQDNECMAHFHSSIELVYVVDGVMSAILDGQRYDASKGCLLIASGYTVHRYFTEKTSDVIILIIPLSFVPAMHKQLDGKCFSSPIYEDERGEMSALIPLMYKNWEALGSEAKQGFSQMLLGILIDRVGLCDARSKAPLGLTQNVLLYLNQNYASPLSMEKLARHFGYSRSRLSHLFRDNFGCTLTEYVNSLRCRQAARLLMESDLSQLEISMTTGFECIRTFYRAFRQCYGITPGQYVKSSGRPGFPLPADCGPLENPLKQ